MVLAEAKFRVSKFAADSALNTGGAIQPTTPSYGPYNPINFGIPGTAQYPGAEQYPVFDPNPNSCKAGFARVSGFCVPISSLPACPAGYVRDTNTGLCVVLPPPPPTPGTTPPAGVAAYVTRIQLPSYAYAGLATEIRTWFKNLLDDQAAYAIRIQLPSISLDHTTPILVVPRRSSALIKSSFTIPTAATQQVVAGTIELQRHTGGTPAVVVEDTENITMYLQPIPSPTTNCPTGYHRDTTTNQCVPDTVPPPTPTPTATITVTPSTVVHNRYVASAGTGFYPGEIIDLAIEVTSGSSKYRTTEVDQAESNGTFSDRSMRVPNHAGPGTMSARGRRSARVATATITVT